MNFVQFITTRSFLKHFLISLIITLVIAWITLLILKKYTRHGETTMVPKFTGLTYDQAMQLETSSDFEFLVVDSIFDMTKKRRYNPHAGPAS